MGLLNLDTAKTSADYEQFLAKLESLAAENPDNKSAAGVGELAGALRDELAQADDHAGNGKREQEIIRALNDGLVGLDFGKPGGDAVKQRIVDFIHDIGKVSKSDIQTLKSLLADARNEIGVGELDRYGVSDWSDDAVAAKTGGDARVWDAALGAMRRNGVGDTAAEKRVLDALADKLPDIDWSKPGAGDALNALVAQIQGAGRKVSAAEAAAIVAKLGELASTHGFRDPKAVNDSLGVEANVEATTNGVKLNVLANDTDGNGDDRRVVLVDAGAGGKTAKGKVTLSEDGNMVYTPDEGASGQDKVSYWISDGKGGHSKATVTIDITAPKDGTAPQAVEDHYTTDAGKEIQIGVDQGVLKNDVDAEKAAKLKVTGFVQPDHGTATVYADGSVTYKPKDGFSGTDHISYKVKDGSGKESTGTITIQVGAGGATQPAPQAPDDVPSTGDTPSTDDTHGALPGGCVLHPTDPDNASGIHAGVQKLIEDILALSKEGKLSTSEFRQLISDALALTGDGLAFPMGTEQPQGEPGSKWQAAVDPATGKPVTEDAASGPALGNSTNSRDYGAQLTMIGANFRSTIDDIMKTFKENNKDQGGAAAA